MNRRIAVRNLALVIGGSLLLPACLQEHGKASIALKAIDLNAQDEALIADIAETIIPKTTTPGARELHLHLFAMKMLDDCYKTVTQKEFVSGLSQFRALVSKTYHKPFAECTVQQREQLLTGLEKQPAKTDLQTFYHTVKQLTVYGYTTSKFFMTNEVVYELVPGRYNGYFPVSKMKTHPKYA